jgi:type 1 glutamine amidotransferase/sugar phosphate isomerase/epimerase
MKREIRAVMLSITIGATIGSLAAQTSAQAPPDQAARGAGRGGRGPQFNLPSVSVRPPDQGRFRTTAATQLGWRLGVRTDAFGPLTFSEGVAKADAAGLALVEGVSTQKVSPEIPKNLDYNLTADEVTKVKNRLDELRLRMPAYYVTALPADESSQRKIFEFVKGLGVDTIIAAAEPASFPGLDKLANEFATNVAVAPRDPNTALSALEGRSKRIGVSVDLGAWMEAGIKPLAGLSQLKDKVLAVNLRDRSALGAGGRNVRLGAGAANAPEFLVELSRLQPPTRRAEWPPSHPGGAPVNELKPLFFSVDSPGTDLMRSADAYDQAVRLAIGYRVRVLSRLETISPPESVAADQKQRIDSAIPRQVLVKPKKARKLLVMDLCVNGSEYHAAIPQGNLALQLIGKYTGAYEAVFSNDVDNLKYPQIKQYDAVFLNSIQGPVFIDPDVIHGLLRYVGEGGGVAALHATSYASMDVPEFGELIGAQSGAHKYNGEPGSLCIDDPTSPLTKHFGGKGFDFVDEFYHFLPTGPYSREKLHVLLSLDPEKTELSGNQYKTRPDNDYGMVWISSHGKGRVFNCALGHRPEFYETPRMEQLVLAGIQFVLGDLDADTTPSAKLPMKR